jgi:hypothetical protein
VRVGGFNTSPTPSLDQAFGTDPKDLIWALRAKRKIKAYLRRAVYKIPIENWTGLRKNGKGGDERHLNSRRHFEREVRERCGNGFIEGKMDRI